MALVACDFNIGHFPLDISGKGDRNRVCFGPFAGTQQSIRTFEMQKTLEVTAVLDHIGDLRINDRISCIGVEDGYFNSISKLRCTPNAVPGVGVAVVQKGNSPK